MRKVFVWVLPLGYWGLYTLLIFVIALVAQQGRGGHALPPKIFFESLFYFTWLPSFVAFQGSYGILFTRYATKKAWAHLALGGFVFAFGGALFGAAALSIRFGAGIMFKDGFTSFWQELTVMLFIGLIHGTLGLVLRGFVTWAEEIQLKQQLAQKNYEMELALVKAQIHPHFLFNTLNNIDVLVEKNSKMASVYLNKLSDILRFMLFETKPDRIPLKKELSYVEEYLDLQRLRASHPDYVRYTVQGDVSQVQVPPMLFIPFIENAFTHSEAHKADPAISIQFDVKTGRLDFICENKFSAFQNNLKPAGGLGLSLMKKRLSLLYPNKHTLEIEKMLGSYRVHLTLETA